MEMSVKQGEGRTPTEIRVLSFLNQVDVSGETKKIKVLPVTPDVKAPELLRRRRAKGKDGRAGRAAGPASRSGHARQRLPGRPRAGVPRLRAALRGTELLRGRAEALPFPPANLHEPSR